VQRRLDGAGARRLVRRDASAAEHEAAALVLGFLTMQMLICLITGRPRPPIHGFHDVRSVGEIALLMLSGLLFLLALTSVSFAKVHFAPGRGLFNFRAYLAMAMAWCLERSGEWAMYRQFEELALARVWSAFATSALSVLCVIAINLVMDRTLERQQRLACARRVRPEDLEALDSACTREGPPPAEGGPLVSMEPTPDDPSWSELSRMQEELNDDTPMEQAVQIIVNGFSVLIGLVWDLAFEAAEEAIVAPVRPEDVEGPFQDVQLVFGDHPVFAKCFLACILTSVVLPGWVWHIVPSAKKPWRHHFENIARSLQQNKVVSWPR